MSDGRFPGARFESLVLKLLPETYGEEVLGDLVEEARLYVLPRRGVGRARLWILAQALRSVPALARMEWEEEAMEDRDTKPATGRTWGSMGIGLLIFFAYIVADLAPGPWGWAALYAIFFVLLTAAGVMTWRRTPFRLMAAVMVLGAAAEASFLVGVFVEPGLTPSHPAVLWASGALLVVWLVAYYADRKRHPEAWDEWKRHIRRTHPMDFFLMRHIPDMR